MRSAPTSGRRPLEPVGIAAGEDDGGALGARPAGGFEPDPGAAADHDDGLPGQFRFARVETGVVTAFLRWVGAGDRPPWSQGRACKRNPVLSSSLGQARHLRVHRAGLPRHVRDVHAECLQCRVVDPEKLGKGWIVSLSTSTGTWARMASVACCSHSPDSGPSA